MVRRRHVCVTQSNIIPGKITGGSESGSSLPDWHWRWIFFPLGIYIANNYLHHFKQIPGIFTEAIVCSIQKRMFVLIMEHSTFAFNKCVQFVTKESTVFFVCWGAINIFLVLLIHNVPFQVTLKYIVGRDSSHLGVRSQLWIMLYIDWSAAFW